MILENKYRSRNAAIEAALLKWTDLVSTKTGTVSTQIKLIQGDDCVFLAYARATAHKRTAFVEQYSWKEVKNRDKEPT